MSHREVMATNELSDLIARVAMRDREAFRLLYVKTNAKLFSVALRILRERAAAEDCVQEVYVKIWNNAAKYTVAGYSPITWLCAIARYDAIDRIRANKNQAVNIEDIGEVASTAPNPETISVESSEMRRINACLRELKPEHAQAVRSAYVDGFSYQELADNYNMPLNTVRTWLRRSLQSLKACLER
jgi:RNA polymerase sigma-70 factor, ECF subfamily